MPLIFANLKGGHKLGHVSHAFVTELNRRDSVQERATVRLSSILALLPIFFSQAAQLADF